MIIGRFRVSNSGPNAKYLGAVRVYLDGRKVGEVIISQYNPLKYLRAHPASHYCDRLAGQLREAGASDTEIAQILCG